MSDDPKKGTKIGGERVTRRRIFSIERNLLGTVH